MGRLTLCGEKELIALVKLRDKLIQKHTEITRWLAEESCCQFYRNNIYQDGYILLSDIIRDYLNEKENENI